MDMGRRWTRHTRGGYSREAYGRIEPKSFSGISFVHPVCGLLLLFLLATPRANAQPADIDDATWTKTYPPHMNNAVPGYEEPEPTLSGIVVDRDGSPVPGADVFITGSIPPSMDGNRFRHRNHISPTTVARTGPAGEFFYPPSPEKKVVYAMANAGCYLQSGIHLDGAPLKIVLEPWSQVRVVRGEDAQPWDAFRTAYLWNTQDPEEGGILGLARHYEGEREDDTYSFVQVIPGRYTVECRKAQRTGTSHHVAVNVAPGEVLTVVVGGDGRPVLGRMAVPEVISESVDWSRSAAILHPIERPAVDAAPEKSDARTVRPAPAVYATCPDDRRTFRLEDVAPGRYTLTIRLPQVRVGGAPPGYDVLGEVKTRVDVPVLAGNGGAEVFDLGELLVKPVGGEAP